MQPSEFWQLSTQEFWWEFDEKYKASKRMKEKSGTRGKFSTAEWEAARKRFREMEDVEKSRS